MQLPARALAAAFLLTAALAAPRPLLAEEKPAADVSALSVKELLAANLGKRVSLRLSGGEPIEGVVSKVGDQAVLLANLTGRDFYDAWVRLERIEAVVYRAR
jgi:hypothetical protein